MSPQGVPTAGGTGIPPTQHQAPQQQQEAAAAATDTAAEVPSGTAGTGGGTSDTPSGSSMSNDAVLELVDGFLAVQRERAGAYRRFDAAFRAFLQSKAEGIYR